MFISSLTVLRIILIYKKSGKPYVSFLIFWHRTSVLRQTVSNLPHEHFLFVRIKNNTYAHDTCVIERGNTCTEYYLACSLLSNFDRSGILSFCTIAFGSISKHEMWNSFFVFLTFRGKGEQITKEIVFFFISVSFSKCLAWCSQIAKRN